MTKRSKTVLPEVRGEGVEGDDCGAGHLRQEVGEPGRAGRKGPTQALAVPVYSVSCWCLGLVHWSHWRSKLDWLKTGRCEAYFRRSPGSTVLTGGQSWTDGRQADVRLFSWGPLGALVSLEVKAGLTDDRQRWGLVQEVPWGSSASLALSLESAWLWQLPSLGQWKWEWPALLGTVVFLSHILNGIKSQLCSPVDRMSLKHWGCWL